MQAVPDTLIAIGFLIFLIGIVWVIVTRLGHRGWKTPAIFITLAVAVINIGGLISLSDVFGHDHSLDPYFDLYPATLQETIAFSLMLLGFFAVLVGIVWVIKALFRSARRRTPAVMIGLGVAVMLQGGILQLETYELPHDHTISGWFEREWVEAAMIAMMVDKEVGNVIPNTSSTNAWSENPGGTGTAPLYPTYLQETNTTCFYCWDSSGNITRQDKFSATCGAPVKGSVTIPPCAGQMGEPWVGRADSGYLILVGATAVVVAVLTGAFVWIKRKAVSGGRA